MTDRYAGLPPHEEGEPESIFEEDDPEHVAFVQRVAEEHGFPLSDWKPTIPPFACDPMVPKGYIEVRDKDGKLLTRHRIE